MEDLTRIIFYGYSVIVMKRNVTGTIGMASTIIITAIFKWYRHNRANR